MSDQNNQENLPEHEKKKVVVVKKKPGPSSQKKKVVVVSKTSGQTPQASADEESTSQQTKQSSADENKQVSNNQTNIEQKFKNIFEVNQNVRKSPREQGNFTTATTSKKTEQTSPPSSVSKTPQPSSTDIRKNIDSGRRGMPPSSSTKTGQNFGPQRSYPAKDENFRSDNKRPNESQRVGSPNNKGPRPFQRTTTSTSRPFENKASAGFGSSSSFTAIKGEPVKKFRQKKTPEKEKVFSKEKEKEKEKLDKLMINRKQQTQKANPIPKQIEILEAITVNELAKKMNLKVSDVISRLMQMGLMVTMNQQIDHETAAILAAEYGTEVKVISLYDETIIKSDEDVPERMVIRPPVVTVMGHVDHGKTKLLDAIRQTDVVSGEYGGITQHIGAYQVHDPRGAITFLDTPGHEAFSMMRARGAQITDVVVLVVAANDGVMPQTVEAIRHAQEAKVPIIVAINKIDLPDANPDRVKQQLSEYNLAPEEWGGTTLYVEISALKKKGIDSLLEAIHLQAEVLDLKADPVRRAEGRVIETRIDQGRGVISTVLIQKGTLRIGDAFVGGIFPGKVRAMFNDKGQSITEAGPSTPVEIMGFEGIPDAGDPFQVTQSEKEAKEYAEKRQELKKQESSKNVKKITLSNIYDKIQEENMMELKVIIKADTHGSMEALKGALTKLSTNEIRLNVIHAATGPIVREDVYLAAASKAIIIGFHVRPNADSQAAADQEKVEIRKYNIIYDAVDDIRAAMEGMLSPEIREEQTGIVEVRELFKVPKVGMIAGCHVTQGKIKRTSVVHVIRDGIQVYSGKLTSLKRFKDDVKEVSEGFDCGIGIDNFQEIAVGDIIEAYDIIKIAKKLGTPS